MKKAFDEGWGGVIVKTLSLDAKKVVNVTPRYAKLRDGSGAVFGWENIELISDRCGCTWRGPHLARTVALRFGTPRRRASPTRATLLTPPPPLPPTPPPLPAGRLRRCSPR